MSQQGKHIAAAMSSVDLLVASPPFPSACRLVFVEDIAISVTTLCTSKQRPQFNLQSKVRGKLQGAGRRLQPTPRQLGCAVGTEARRPASWKGNLAVDAVSQLCMSRLDLGSFVVETLNNFGPGHDIMLPKVYVNIRYISWFPAVMMFETTGEASTR